MVPRRLVPIALVAASLVAAQVSLSRDPLGTPLSLLMVVAFVTLAPLSWRVLFPEGLDLAHGAIRLVLYVIVGAGVVLTLGAVVPKVTGMGETFLTTRPSLIVCGMLFLVGGWALARDIGLEESLDRERRRADLLVKEADQARLLALRTHLDPHFLFNTLNAIAEWCREDGEVAERAVLQLSSMLRTILSGVRSSTWPIARELELLSTLFDLHRMRDPNLFTVTIDVAGGAGELAVPPLVLLPLAENAVKHGPAAGHRGEIAVSVTRAGGQATIRISNPGPYRGPREGSEGVPSVRERLQSAFGSAARFDLRAEGERTVAELSLPVGAVP
ncbi:MAG: histidine kinase [Acidobacteria bacterium]|nr:histidine kinase [Acidobacteriota bacterium]